MVTEQRNGTRDRDTRNGDGVAARFRPLGTASGEAPADPAPPEFATAPWGYRRAEVDAWASWVAGIVAQARAETVRADSAEATLRATLDRLERLERPAAPADPTPPGPDPTPARPRPEPEPRTDGGVLPRRGVRAASARWSMSGPDIEAVRDAAPEPAPGTAAPEPPPSRTPAGTEPATGSTTARLQIVESTLHEVMRLLTRLAEHPDRSPTGS